MKTRLLGLIACMALISLSQASAATLVGTVGDATGIDGLVVDGSTYNVTFENASYDAVYTSAPTFLGNESAAVDAATAITSALNSLGVMTLTGLTGSSQGQYLFVPYDSDPTNDSLGGTGVVGGATPYCAVAPCVSPSMWDTSEGSASESIQYPNYDFAVFTPLPPALPLFAAGLGALGLFGWRRKRKDVAAIAAA